MGRTGREHLSLGGYHLTRDQIINGHPVLAYEPAHSTPECQTSDSRLRNNATGYGKAECVSLSVEIAERCAALYPHYAVMRIYADASHVREIDNDAVIAE